MNAPLPATNNEVRWWPHVAIVLVILTLTGLVTTALRDHGPGRRTRVLGEQLAADVTTPRAAKPSVQQLAAEQFVVEQAQSLIEESVPTAPPVAPVGAQGPAITTPPIDTTPPSPPASPTDPVMQAVRDAVDRLTPLIDQLSTTLAPYLYEGATQLMPVATALGPTVRPVCASLGFSVVALTVLSASGDVPLPPNAAKQLGPIFVFCSATYDPSPLDPVFGLLDAVLGPTISSQVVPTLTQIGAQLAPVRDALAPLLGEACPNLELAGGVEAQMPPPADRVSAIRLLCKGDAAPR